MNHTLHRLFLGVTPLFALHLFACAHAPPHGGTGSMNMGFEEAPRGLPEGWHVGTLGGFEVARDASMSRTGGNSVRIASTPGGRYGALSRRIDAAPLVGKRVRLHGWVMTKAVTGWARRS